MAADPEFAPKDMVSGVPPDPVSEIALVVTVPENVGDADSTTLPEPVEDVTPVPPFATGNVPETCVVRAIFPQLGAVLTPPEIRALPVATPASFDNAEVVEAYSRSPTA